MSNPVNDLLTAAQAGYQIFHGNEEERRHRDRQSRQQMREGWRAQEMHDLQMSQHEREREQQEISQRLTGAYQQGYDEQGNWHDDRFAQAVANDPTLQDTLDGVVKELTVDPDARFEGFTEDLGPGAMGVLYRDGGNKLDVLADGPEPEAPVYQVPTADPGAAIGALGQYNPELFQHIIERRQEMADQRRRAEQQAELFRTLTGPSEEGSQDAQRSQQLMAEGMRETMPERPGKGLVSALQGDMHRQAVADARRSGTEGRAESPQPVNEPGAQSEGSDRSFRTPDEFNALNLGHDVFHGIERVGSGVADGVRAYGRGGLEAATRAGEAAGRFVFSDSGYESLTGVADRAEARLIDLFGSGDEQPVAEDGQPGEVDVDRVQAGGELPPVVAESSRSDARFLTPGSQQRARTLMETPHAPQAAEHLHRARQGQAENQRAGQIEAAVRSGAIDAADAAQLLNGQQQAEVDHRRTFFDEQGREWMQREDAAGNPIGEPEVVDPRADGEEEPDNRFDYAEFESALRRDGIDRDQQGPYVAALETVQNRAWAPDLMQSGQLQNMTHRLTRLSDQYRNNQRSLIPAVGDDLRAGDVEAERVAGFFHIARMGYDDPAEFQSEIGDALHTAEEQRGMPVDQSLQTSSRLYGYLVGEAGMSDSDAKQVVRRAALGKGVDGSDLGDTPLRNMSQFSNEQMRAVARRIAEQYNR